jgi:hypothetical protein
LRSTYAPVARDGGSAGECRLLRARQDADGRRAFGAATLVGGDGTGAPGLREAWDAGDVSSFHGWDKETARAV